MRRWAAFALLALCACGSDDEPSRPDARLVTIDAPPPPPDALCGPADPTLLNDQINAAFWHCGWPSEGGIVCVSITTAITGLAASVDATDQGDPLAPGYLDCMRANLLGDCLAYRPGVTETH